MKSPLAKVGILGINQRNLDYVLAENPRHLYPLVDNKVLTKDLAEKHGVPTPRKIAVIEYQAQARKVTKLTAGNKSFVIKPARGSGGGGILVISDSEDGIYFKPSGALVNQRDLQYHVQNILSGMYSFGGQDDVALIEEMVEFDPIFEDIAYQGVPDIRLISYRGVPTMAMVRLPTRASDGKANLHVGGIGVGIDLATGITTTGVQFGKITNRHPDTRHMIAGRQIPFWPEMLSIAARMYDYTGLGYLGVDIVLDKTQGPLLLEVNARPGIAIQIANQCGLLDILERIQDLSANAHTVEERIALGTGVYSSLVKTN
jgi:alpha-L-glutamate ligase-like protein